MPRKPPVSSRFFEEDWQFPPAKSFAVWVCKNFGERELRLDSTGQSSTALPLASFSGGASCFVILNALVGCVFFAHQEAGLSVLFDIFLVRKEGGFLPFLVVSTV
jgi:hypothetical protein